MTVTMPQEELSSNEKLFLMEQLFYFIYNLLMIFSKTYDILYITHHKRGICLYVWLCTHFER